MSVRSVRSDSKRNRVALLQSAGELVRASGSSVTMNSIAEHAGLSVATAYRHFPSLESVFEAYMFDVAHELRTYSLSLETPGPELLPRVARKWIELCLVHGPATVHMRSRRGYLERLHEGRRLPVGPSRRLTAPHPALRRIARSDFGPRRRGTCAVSLEYPLRSARNPGPARTIGPDCGANVRSSCWPPSTVP